MRRFEVKGKAAKKLAGLVLTAALALSAAFSSMAPRLPPAKSRQALPTEKA